MTYLNQKAIKTKVHDAGKQITKEGLEALDRKIDDYLNRLCGQFNGHKTRIDAVLVNLIKL